VIVRFCNADRQTISATTTTPVVHRRKDKKKNDRRLNRASADIHLINAPRMRPINQDEEPGDGSERETLELTTEASKLLSKRTTRKSRLTRRKWILPPHFRNLTWGGTTKCEDAPIFEILRCLPVLCDEIGLGSA